MKTEKIYSINSEDEIKNDLIWNFKYNRKFEQKALYLGGGADNYYHQIKISRSREKAGFNWKKNYNFLKKTLLINQLILHLSVLVVVMQIKKKKC